MKNLLIRVDRHWVNLLRNYDIRRELKTDEKMAE